MLFRSDRFPGRSVQVFNGANKRTQNRYDACVKKVFGESGGYLVPPQWVAGLSLVAGWLDPNLSAGTAPILQTENENFAMYPKGDRGPAQLTDWWSRNHSDLIVVGSYDTFPRPKGSPNRDSRL